MTIGSGGRLAPGNSIGAMAVTGNWELASGGTYEVELKRGGNTAGTHSDVTNVTGTATIRAGSQIEVTPENGTDDGRLYTAGTRYTILTSGGLTVAGDPTIMDDFAFLDFTGSHDAQNYFLTSSRAVPSLCLADATGNQCATGTGVAALGVTDPVPYSTSRMRPPVRGWMRSRARGMPPRRARFRAMARPPAMRFLIAWARPLPRWKAGERWATPRAGIAQSDARGGAWASPFAAHTRLEGDANTAALNATSGGMLMGGDIDFGNWIVGGFAGAGRTGISVPARATSVSATDLSLGAYAGIALDDTAFAFGASWTHSFVEATRQVVLGGFDQTLEGAYGADTLSAFGEVAHSFDFGASALTPYARLGLTHQTADAFTETGGSAALSVSPTALTRATTELGVRAQTQMAMGTTLATLSGGIGWQHRFGGDPQTANSFAGGTPFTVHGAPGPRDALVLDAGLDLDVSENANFALGYTGRLSGTGQAHAIKADFAVTF